MDVALAIPCVHARAIIFFEQASSVAARLAITIERNEMRAQGYLPYGLTSRRRHPDNHKTRREAAYWKLSTFSDPIVGVTGRSSAYLLGVDRRRIRRRGTEEERREERRAHI